MVWDYDVSEQHGFHGCFGIRTMTAVFSCCWDGGWAVGTEMSTDFPEETT